MKRIALMVAAVLGLALSSGRTYASWGALCYSGYQPCWNIFAHRYKCLTPEEERLQKFWHDYYSALKSYYCDLDHIDRVRQNWPFLRDRRIDAYGNLTKRFLD